MGHKILRASAALHTDNFGMPPQVLSSPALCSNYQSGRVRLCPLCRRNPRLPLSQRAAQALSSLSSPALASQYHSGRLRLGHVCRRSCLPLSQWEAAQRTEINPVGLIPKLIISRHKISWIHISTGAKNLHGLKPWKQPQGPKHNVLDEGLMNITFEA